MSGFCHRMSGNVRQCPHGPWLNSFRPLTGIDFWRCCLHWPSSKACVASPSCLTVRAQATPTQAAAPIGATARQYGKKQSPSRTRSFRIEIGVKSSKTERRIHSRPSRKLPKSFLAKCQERAYRRSYHRRNSFHGKLLIFCSESADLL
jgi:hypothetical protein